MLKSSHKKIKCFIPDMESNKNCDRIYNPFPSNSNNKSDLHGYREKYDSSRSRFSINYQNISQNLHRKHSELISPKELLKTSQSLQNKSNNEENSKVILLEDKSQELDMIMNQHYHSYKIGNPQEVSNGFILSAKKKVNFFTKSKAWAKKQPNPEPSQHKSIEKQNSDIGVAQNNLELYNLGSNDIGFLVEGMKGFSETKKEEKYMMLSHARKFSQTHVRKLSQNFPITLCSENELLDLSNQPNPILQPQNISSSKKLDRPVIKKLDLNKTAQPNTFAQPKINFINNPKDTNSFLINEENLKCQQNPQPLNPKSQNMFKSYSQATIASDKNSILRNRQGTRGDTHKTRIYNNENLEYDVYQIKPGYREKNKTAFLKVDNSEFIAQFNEEKKAKNPLSEKHSYSRIDVKTGWIPRHRIGPKKEKLKQPFLQTCQKFVDLRPEIYIGKSVRGWQTGNQMRLVRDVNAKDRLDRLKEGNRFSLNRTFTSSALNENLEKCDPEKNMIVHKL